MALEAKGAGLMQEETQNQDKNLFLSLLANYWRQRFKNLFFKEQCNCKVCVNARNAKNNSKKQN